MNVEGLLKKHKNRKADIFCTEINHLYVKIKEQTPQYFDLYCRTFGNMYVEMAYFLPINDKNLFYTTSTSFKIQTLLKKVLFVIELCYLKYKCNNLIRKML